VIVRGRYVHIRGDSGGERLWAVNAAGKGGAAALEGLTRAPAVVVGDDPAAIAPHIRRLQVSQVELSGGFRDLSALAGCSSIRRLSLPGSHALTNLDALGTLTGLEDLSVAYCSGLTDLEGLRRLKNLTSLLLTDLDHVIDLKVLEGMTKLRMLSLHGCTGLTSVEALQGLSSLKEVNLSGCTGLSAEQVGNLKKALPDCSIEWSPPKGPPGGKATKKTE